MLKNNINNKWIETSEKNYPALKLLRGNQKFKLENECGFFENDCGKFSGCMIESNCT